MKRTLAVLLLTCACAPNPKTAPDASALQVPNLEERVLVLLWGRPASVRRAHLHQSLKGTFRYARGSRWPWGASRTGRGGWARRCGGWRSS